MKLPKIINKTVTVQYVENNNTVLPAVSKEASSNYNSFSKVGIEFEEMVNGKAIY